MDRVLKCKRKTYQHKKRGKTEGQYRIIGFRRYTAQQWHDGAMHIQQYYGHFSFDERFKKGGKGKYSKVQPRVEEILRSGGSVVLA